MMEVNNQHNQSYWFVVREDQSNVIFSSNHFSLQNTQIGGQETRYIVDAVDNRQYLIQDNVQDTPTEEDQKTCIKETARATTSSNSTSKDHDHFWDQNKIKLLLTLCLDIRFKCPNNDKMLWNEISILVGATPEECDKKYKNLRRTYIRLLNKRKAGKEIKWTHYKLCEEIFKDCKSLSLAVDSWEDSKVRTLLNLYIENISKFRSGNWLKKDVWKEIASQINTTEYNCYHKFKNLKRTYFKFLERTRESGNLVKWPYSYYFERIYYNYSPEITWDRNKIRLLINAYSVITDKFRNPRYQKKELWKEISEKVGESPGNCDRKFRNLKQTYLRLKIKADSGRTVTKWRYYKDFNHIFENADHTYANLDYCEDITQKNIYQNYVKQLLEFYIENKAKFKDPLVRNRSLWKQVSLKLGLTPEECDKKFRNLKQTYIRLAEKKRDTGKDNGWPYFCYFEQIYDEPKKSIKECNHSCNLDKTTLSEIRNIVYSHEAKDKDKFEKLVRVMEDSNSIQRERNRILAALLDRKRQ